MCACMCARVCLCVCDSPTVPIFQRPWGCLGHGTFRASAGAVPADWGG